MNYLSLVQNVLWNGMLAVIPVVLAYAIVWLSRIHVYRWVKYLAITILGFVWLDFLPNTCYLLTEWRHFLYYLDSQNLFVRSQYEQVLFIRLCALSFFYFLYSGFGMLMFVLAIRPIKHLAAKKGATIELWVIPFFVVLSLGVYLGLILRFNSWDPLWSHAGILKIWNALVMVGSRPKLMAFIFMFGMFLWIAYEAMDIWIDGISDRWSRATGKRMHLGPEI